MFSLTRIEEHIFARRVSLKFSNEFSETTTFLTANSLWHGDHFIVDNLQSIKDELNSSKAQLNGKSIADWHAHTHFTNPSRGVICALRKLVKAELCTQAWCKFFEVLHVFPDLILQSDSHIFHSYHLCEAPGAFVSALNHYLRQHHVDLKWRWFASTLNPYYESHGHNTFVSDDRLVINALDNWNFGSDNTGNMYSRMNFDHICSSIQDEGIDLVTADGSFCCQSHPGEQESTTFHLHYCEVLTALKLLRRGGCFVLKMFTAFEDNTICLVFLLCKHFDNVDVVKPCTSKCGNSEVYLVCRNFLGMADELMAELCKFYDDIPSDKALLPLETLPEAFVDRIVQTQCFFADLQMSMIRFNLYSFQHKSFNIRAHISAVQRRITEEFFERYKPEKIAPEQRLCIAQLHPAWDDAYLWDGLEGKYETRFVEDLTDLCARVRTRLTVSNLAVAKQFERGEPAGWIEHLRTKIVDLCEKPDVKPIIVGQRYGELRNSKFCNPELLALYWELRTALSKSDAAFAVENCDFVAQNIDILLGHLHIAEHPCLADYKVALLEWYLNIDSQDDIILKHSKLLWLSRFSVAFMALLTVRFERIEICRQNGETSMILGGLRVVPAAVKRLCEQILRKCESVPNGKDVLEIFPMNLLAERKLYYFLAKHNDMMLIEFTTAMLPDVGYDLCERTAM